MKLLALAILTLVSLAQPVMSQSRLMGATQDYNKGLAAWIRGDHETALEYFKPLAQNGHTESQYNLFAMYNNGKGVPQDYKTAVKWLRLAAEKGHASAQNNLGLKYDQGLGVPQDHKTALRWFKLAAEQGNAGAQFNLGVMYQYGKGNPQGQ